VKKLNVILLIISFILSGIGGIFLFDVNTSTNDSIQTTAPSNKMESEEITEYTYKTYEDYFIDYFNLPAETYTRDEATNVVTIDYSKITRKAANGEIELSYNGNLFYTVTSDDLTGTGSETDPYVVHSTNGFLFLTNNSISKITLSAKYVELNCNIVLNDETFDKEGNPSGGDGCYYNWRYDWYASVNFDGNGHTISGLYGKTHAGDTAIEFKRALFGCSIVNSIENLTMKNVYMDGKGQRSTSVITRSVRKIINCKVISGMIRGSTYVSSLVYTSYYTQDCENHADLYSDEGHVGGVICSTLGDVFNCVNYGNVVIANTVEMGRAGGIMYGCDYRVSDITISNCKNYGNIYAASSNQNAGIVSWGHGEVLNCKNYGNIYAASSNQNAGIVSYLRDYLNLSIINCSNYADIQGSEYNSGQIFGQSSALTGNNSVILIKNCYSYSTSRLSIAAYILRNATIKIQGCKTEYVGASSATRYFALFGRVITSVNMEIENVEIIHNSSSNETFYLFCSVEGDSKVKIKNVVVRFKKPVKNVKLNYYGEINPVLEGVVIQGESFNQIYGSDFSGFYFSWRTGKIGLIALDGRGSFQGTIDEKWLKSKGYEKKDV